MRPFILATPGSIQRQIARRAVAARLALGWTRQELAERSGVAVDTLKRFEQTGQVSLERLLRIALALDALREFSGLFPEPLATSLDELEARSAGRHRVRARGRRTTRTTWQGSASGTHLGRAGMDAADGTSPAPGEEGGRAPS